MPKEPEHTAFLDQVYHEVEGVDPNLLSLDFYVPDDDRTDRPVMIMIHGGGDKGTPAMAGAKRNHFVGNGYIYSGVDVEAAESRGILILVVEETIRNA